MIVDCKRYKLKPKLTKLKISGRERVYFFEGRFYIKDKKYGCNALEGFVEIKNLTDQMLVYKSGRY